MKWPGYILLVCSFLFASCSFDNEIPRKQGTSTNNEPGLFIDDWTYSVYPKNEDTFSTAEFAVWVPNATSLNGVLVLSGHNNSNSLYLAQDEQWQSFASAQKLAILATYLVSSGSGHYGYANKGSGNALITAFNKIAEKNNIANFNRLPFYLRGYSAGGIFSYSFSEYFSSKTAAIVDIRGGIESDNNNNINNLKIPGLIVVGEQETSRIERVKSIIANKRSRNGLWSYAIEPNAHHSSDQNPSDELARVFFAKVLENSADLNNESINFLEQGFLGNNETQEFYSYFNYTEDVTKASWLIDESFAQAWKEYQ